MYKFQDHPSQATPHVQNQFHSCPIAEWNVEHVRNWLIGIEMDRYIPLFADKSITGLQLVIMDSNKFKVSFLLGAQGCGVSIATDWRPVSG